MLKYLVINAQLIPQTIGSKGTQVTSLGNFRSDSTLGVPKRLISPGRYRDTGSVYYRISDSAILKWTGNAWRNIVGARQLNDSMLIVGDDTITIRGTGGGGTPGGDEYSLQFKNPGGALGGDSIKYNPSDNNLVMTKSYLQFGRRVTGFFTTSDATSSHGYIKKVYPRGSGGTGADTLNYFYEQLETSRYDLARGENAVYTILGSKTDASIVPRWSIRVEDNFYDDIEYHGFTWTPLLMPNPNQEIRGWSWNASRINGLSVLAQRSSSHYWNESFIGTNFDRQYALLSPAGLTLNTWQNPQGSISLRNGNGASTEISYSLMADTSTAEVRLVTNSNTQTLYLGEGVTNSSPASSTTGTFRLDKNTTVSAKTLLITNTPAGNTGFGVQSALVGYIYSIGADGSGFADVATTGRSFINRDNAISETDRLGGIFNHYNINDSIIHWRGNGNLWTKGLVNIRTLKTTLTAPATQGTTKMVITDTNGLLSFADIPAGSSYTYGNGLTESAGAVKLGGALTENTTISSSNASYKINITGVNTGQPGMLNVSTSGNSGVAVTGTATGTSAYGLHGVAFGSNGRAIMASATDGTGVFSSATGVAFHGESTSGKGIEISSSFGATNSLSIVNSYSVQTAGTAANGIGGINDFYAEMSNGSTDTAARITWEWTNATAGSQTGALKFWTKNNAGNIANRFQIAGDGKLIASAYGSGTFTGTPASYLVSTSTGDVVEQSATTVPLISTGTAAPATTPSKVGDIFVDTTNKKLYFATGTSSSADWTIAN
jgi:hypothetical protein